MVRFIFCLSRVALSFSLLGAPTGAIRSISFLHCPNVSGQPRKCFEHHRFPTSSPMCRLIHLESSSPLRGSSSGLLCNMVHRCLCVWMVVSSFVVVFLDFVTVFLDFVTVFLDFVVFVLRLLIPISQFLVGLPPILHYGLCQGIFDHLMRSVPHQSAFHPNIP